MFLAKVSRHSMNIDFVDLNLYKTNMTRHTIVWLTEQSLSLIVLTSHGRD